jgi:hypothetical protein
MGSCSPMLAVIPYALQGYETVCCVATHSIFRMPLRLWPRLMLPLQILPSGDSVSAVRLAETKGHREIARLLREVGTGCAHTRARAYPLMHTRTRSLHIRTLHARIHTHTHAYTRIHAHTHAHRRTYAREQGLRVHAAFGFARAHCSVLHPHNSCCRCARTRALCLAFITPDTQRTFVCITQPVRSVHSPG